MAELNEENQTAQHIQLANPSDAEPDENFPEPDENFPEPDEDVPEPDEKVPEPDENASKSDENETKMDETAPESDENASIPDENETKKEENTPKSDPNEPRVDENETKREEIAPESDENTPTSDANAPAFDENETKKEEIAPESDENAPKSDANAPTPDENAPVSDENQTKKEVNVATFDPNTPRTDGNETKANETAPEANSALISYSSDDEEEPMKRDDKVLSPRTAFTKNEIAYIAHINHCCEAGDGFDIFQLLAIGIDTIGVIKDDELMKRHKCVGQCAYLFTALKGILTAATQVIGIGIIMVDFVREGMYAKYGGIEEAVESGICNTAHAEYSEDPEEIFYRFLLSVLAFLFSSFLAYFSMGHLLHIEKGMYKNIKHAKNLNWMNVLWLNFGFVVNIVVSIISVYGSFIVIFFSDNALDMVLNSVALFFIVELDDLLVNPEDYVKIAKYLEKKKDKIVVTNERNDECCWKCVNTVTHCCGWLYALPFQIVRYVTIGLCVVAPFGIAFCY